MVLYFLRNVPSSFADPEQGEVDDEGGGGGSVANCYLEQLFPTLLSPLHPTF